MAKYGEMEWDDNYGDKAEKKVNNKDLFLRLDEGPNKIRLLTKPHQYITHKGVKAVGDRGFGQKVMCSNPDGKGSCPLCDQGHKANARWFFGVIDRKTGAYRLLDTSYQVYSQIKKYANNEEWGDPLKYDLNIIVDKNGGPTGYYSVQPVPHKPLSAADQAIQVDFEDLKRRVSPFTVEQVQKKLEKLLDGGTLFIPPKVEKEGAVKAKSTSTKNGKSSVSVDMEDDGDNMEFPSYDGNN